MYMEMQVICSPGSELRRCAAAGGRVPALCALLSSSDGGPGAHAHGEHSSLGGAQTGGAGKTWLFMAGQGRKLDTRAEVSRHQILLESGLEWERQGGRPGSAATGVGLPWGVMVGEWGVGEGLLRVPRQLGPLRVGRSGQPAPSCLPAARR